jgi:hypothetical protein
VSLASRSAPCLLPNLSVFVLDVYVLGRGPGRGLFDVPPDSDLIQRMEFSDLDQSSGTFDVWSL